MKKKLIGIGILMWFVLFASVPLASAVLYEGNLTGAGGGITATDGWDNASTRLSWSVSDVGIQNGNILWQYDYLFQVPRKDISHMIIEVSPIQPAENFPSCLEIALVLKFTVKKVIPIRIFPNPSGE